MDKNTRWALALAGVVVLIVAAVLIGTQGEDTVETQAPPANEAGQAAATDGATSGGAGRADSTGQRDSGGAAPGGESGKDTGGSGIQGDSGGSGPQADVVSPLLTPGRTATIKVKKGQTVTVRGRSSESAELHVHGYDEIVELQPGKIGSVTFKAKIDGEFEIELHTASAATPVGTLRVNP